MRSRATKKRPEESSGAEITHPSFEYGYRRSKTIYVGLGEHENALDQMEIAYERRDFWVPYARIWFTNDPIRSDPRFKSIMRKIGLER